MIVIWNKLILDRLIEIYGMIEVVEKINDFVVEEINDFCEWLFKLFVNFISFGYFFCFDWWEEGLVKFGVLRFSI